MTVMVAVPIRDSGLERWGANVREKFEALTWFDKELALVPNRFSRNGKKYEPNAKARNLVLDTALKPEHTHVFWMDADLVQVPADIIERLMAISARDVVAPLVYVESPGHWFYDTGGYVLGGRGAKMKWPHFPGWTGGEIELDSVGCCYLAPAALYREHGLRYFVNGGEVEHRGLMGKAKTLGYRVLATASVTVLHAYLPKHGERWH